MEQDYRPVADREDLPGVEGTGRDNANGNDELDADGADHTQAPPANETFVISRPDTESDSGSDGDGDGGSSTTKHGPASSGLAETYPSHISHYTAAWQNCDGPATFVYRQRIWELEMQNNALYREAAMLRDKLFSTERKLDRAERRGDKFELHVKMLEMMGTHRGRSHRHHRTHRRLSRSPSSDPVGRDLCRGINVVVWIRRSIRRRWRREKRGRNIRMKRMKRRLRRSCRCEVALIWPDSSRTQQLIVP
ncbi:hypothetical protein EI94DRAFT_1336312 [Lactarius quietus]|nr:hypothetical protein EI94DRAFT_1336312 [Lactarius quietus]